MHADPETMLEFLARLRDRYGTIEDYARRAGLPADAIDRLRDRLLVAA
jgi:Tyrosine phosphatase family